MKDDIEQRLRQLDKAIARAKDAEDWALVFVGGAIVIVGLSPFVHMLIW